MPQSTPAHLLDVEIQNALVASGLVRYVAGNTPTIVFGPGQQVDISIDIDYCKLPQWETIILTPSPDEPPRWLARMVNIIEGRSISSHPDPDSGEPSHDSVDAALQILAQALTQTLST